MSTHWHTEVEKRNVIATSAILVGIVGLVAFGSVSRGEKVPTECEPLLDRYVELRMRSAYDQTSVPPSKLEEKQDRAKHDPKAAEALGDCAKRLTREKAECAMKAPSADELERCFP